MSKLAVLAVILVIGGVLGRPPVIVKQPVVHEIFFKVSTVEGRERPFEVICEAEGLPKPEYRWTKNGKAFNISEHVNRIEQKHDTGTLKFLKPSNDDEGKYFCYAENEDGTARSTLIILRRAYLENFLNESVIQEMTVEEGESFKLECDAPEGVPTPNIFWMIQTTQGAIKGIENPRITLDPDGNLWFSTVTRAEATKESYYVCSAASATANEYKLGNRITLKVLPRALKLHSPPTLQYASSSNIQVVRGKTVEIFCIYEGSPLPSIAWSRDGEPVEIDQRIFLENYGKTLKIKKTDMKDEGKYTCAFTTEDGEGFSTNFTLSIEIPPKFITEPESRNLTVGGSAEISCIAEGSPEPIIQWYFNGKIIEPSKNIVSNNMIAIKSAELNHKGNYACYASTPTAIISKDIYIDVSET